MCSKLRVHGLVAASSRRQSRSRRETAEAQSESRAEYGGDTREPLHVPQHAFVPSSWTGRHRSADRGDDRSRRPRNRRSRKRARPQRPCSSPMRVSAGLSAHHPDHALSRPDAKTAVATPSPAATSAAWRIVAAREISVKTTHRGFLLPTPVTGLIVGAIGIQLYLADSMGKITVAVTSQDAGQIAGQAEQLAARSDQDVEMTVRQESSADQVRGTVTSGGAEADLLFEDGQWVLLGDSGQRTGRRQQSGSPEPGGGRQARPALGRQDIRRRRPDDDVLLRLPLLPGRGPPRSRAGHQRHGREAEPHRRAHRQLGVPALPARRQDRRLDAPRPRPDRLVLPGRHGRPGVHRRDRIPRRHQHRPGLVPRLLQRGHRSPGPPVRCRRRARHQERGHPVHHHPRQRDHRVGVHHWCRRVRQHPRDPLLHPADLRRHHASPRPGGRDLLVGARRGARPVDRRCCRAHRRSQQPCMPPDVPADRPQAVVPPGHAADGLPPGPTPNRRSGHTSTYPEGL